MKITNTVLVGLFALSIIMNIGLFIKINDIEKKVTQPANDDRKEHSKAEKKDEKEDYDLIMAMSYNQRFIEKLYFAGSNKNWELADFYLEELAEKAEDIAKHNIVEDEINISTLIKEALYSKIEAVDNSIKKQDAKLFQQSYLALIDGCNTCHVNAKHGFIQIQVPTANSFPNQVFTPKK